MASPRVPVAPTPARLPVDLPAAAFIFFLSGIAGLLYEVVWVREFGQLFGNTIHSAAIVTGVFMAGLGLGGWLGGRIADRRYGADRASGLRLYVRAEIAIALLGLALAFLLPRLEGISSAISSYRVDAAGWHLLTPGSYLLRYGVAALLMGPITVLMGCSLTFLIRALVQDDIGNAGRTVGWMYGANTVGAALGSLLADSVWIPSFGVWSAQALAAALNIAAALGGLALLPSFAARARADAGPGTIPPAVSPGDGRKKRSAGATAARTPARTASPLAGPAAALFISGMAAMGLELLWFRFMTGALGQYRSVFSLLLFVILCGSGIGAMAGGMLSRRTDRPATAFALTQCAVALTTLLTFWLFDLESAQALIRGDVQRAAGDLDRGTEALLHLGVMLQVAGLPSFCMGFAYPLANALAQRDGEQVGRRAGALYLGNTFGALSGALLTGFVLLPLGGMKWTTALLAGLAVVAVLPIAATAVRVESAGRAGGLKWLAAALVAGGALAAWTRTPADDLVFKSFRAGAMGSVREFLKPPALLLVSEGLTETVVIADLPDRGRTLFTDGHIMSLTGYAAQRYMRAFVHLPLLHVASPTSVLVICFGVGNTVSAAVLHPSLQRIDVVDTSRNILEQARWFEATNRGALADPRVRVYVNDGRQHLRMQPEGLYDLVTLEPPPLSFAGVGSLYSKEFYALARSRLKPGGLVSQWLPLRQVPGDTVLSMTRAFLEVFPEALLLNGYTGDFLLVGRKDAPLEISPKEIESRLRERPAVREDLARYGFATPTEIVGAFAASPGRLAGAVGGVRTLTDDLPLMEYAPVYRKRSDLPAGLIDVGEVGRWCPTCFADGAPIPALSDLPRYLAFLAQMYGRFVSTPGVSAAGSGAPSIGSITGAEADRLSDTYPYLKRVRAGG